MKTTLQLVKVSGRYWSEEFKLSLCCHGLKEYYDVGNARVIWMSASNKKLYDWDEWKVVYLRNADCGVIRLKDSRKKIRYPCVPVYPNFWDFLCEYSTKKSVWLKFDKEI
jgi:hypothetical protein